MRVSNLRKQQITEAYVRTVSTKSLNRELTEVFAKYNKLSGNLVEDAETINRWTYYMITEGDDFDPLGHMIKDDIVDDIDTATDCVLTIDPPNKKLEIAVDAQSFALPAGYTCPFANICKSMAHRYGKDFNGVGLSIKDFGDVRCYAATEENRFPDVRKKRWTNYDLLRGFKDDTQGMTDLIIRSISFFEQEKKRIHTLRMHESGDFYSQAYFDAWVEVANQLPRILFYGYTKSIEYWQTRKDDLPKNFRMTASVGGMQDDLISLNKFRSATIVDSPEEAAELRLPIDTTDALAAFGDDHFGLLMHGTQSKASGNNSQAIKNAKLAKQVNKSHRVDFDWMQTQRKKFTDS